MKLRFSQEADSLRAEKEFCDDFRKRTGRDYPADNADWEKLLADCGLTPTEVREIRSKLPHESDIAEYYHVDGGLLDLIYARLATKQVDDSIPCYVTLLQMSAIVNRSKKTLERLSNGNDFPAADIEGGGGKPHEWRWDLVRPILEKEYGKILPEIFPADQFVRI